MLAFGAAQFLCPRASTIQVIPMTTSSALPRGAELADCRTSWASKLIGA